MESKESAELLLNVLKAHGSDVDAASRSAKDHFDGIYTVSRMIQDHVELLTDASTPGEGVGLVAVDDPSTPQRHLTERLAVRRSGRAHQLTGPGSLVAVDRSGEWCGSVSGKWRHASAVNPERAVKACVGGSPSSRWPCGPWT